MIEGDPVGPFQFALVVSDFPIAEPEIELPVFGGSTRVGLDLGLETFHDSASCQSNQCYCDTHSGLTNHRCSFRVPIAERPNVRDLRERNLRFPSFRASDTVVVPLSWT